MKKLMLLILVLSVVACSRKGGKLVQEEPSVEKPPVLELPTAEPPTVIEEEEDLPPAQIPPYLVAVLKKTDCYGNCSVFEARLFSNGHLVYKGEKDVPLIGHYESWTETTLLEKIKAAAYGISYFQLSDTYPTNQRAIDDIPKTITYLNFDDQEKTIINNYESPQLLRGFERDLEALLLNVNWTRIEGE